MLPVCPSFEAAIPKLNRLTSLWHGCAKAIELCLEVEESDRGNEFIGIQRVTV